MSDPLKYRTPPKRAFRAMGLGVEKDGYIPVVAGFRFHWWDPLRRLEPIIVKGAGHQEQNTEMSIARIVYEFRWWHWFLFTGRWPMRTLYLGAYRLDKQSRRVIIDRIEEEKYANEPAFRGTYPNNRTRQ